MRKGANVQTAVLIASVLLAVCTGSSVLAAMAEVSTAELILQSSAVVRAEVVSVNSYWNEPRDFILTTVTLRVTDTYKGTVGAPSDVNVIVPGGVVGDIGLGVEHAPQFETGEDVIVLLRTTDQAAFAVVGWEMGKFTIHDGYVIEKGCTLEQFEGEIRRVVDEQTDAEKGE